MLKKSITYCFLLIFLQSKMICWGQNGYGAPVYKQDFGVGNNDPSTFGQALPTGRTSFPFEKATCPAPGNYTVLRRVPVNNCFNKAWIDLSHDNNQTVDFGMMMMVNNTATATHRILYIDTVTKPLCAGGAYRFSMATINLNLIDAPKLCVHGPDYPVFEMRVEDGFGNLIGKDTTAPLTSYTAPPLMGYKFNQEGFNFTMPVGVSKLVLKITLFKSTYECAEDFAIDDIMLRPLGADVAINLDNEPITSIIKSVCFQDNKTVSMSGAMSAYYPNPSIQWQQSTDNGISWTDIPGATTNTYARVFSVADTFLFRLSGADVSKISNPNCRVVSNVIKVEVDGLPQNYTISSNSPVCAGGDLKFTGDGAASYLWTGPNGFADNIAFPHIPFVALKDSGMYYVEVFSVGGCHKKDSVFATVIGTDVHAWSDTAICKGASAELHASAGTSYEWTPAKGISSTTIANPIVTPDVTTVYTVKVTDRYGCSDTANVKVSLRNTVQVKAAMAVANYICHPYDSLSFVDKSGGAIQSRIWNFGNGHTSTEALPPVQYFSVPFSQQTVVASLAVTDATGCADTVYQTIQAVDNCYIAVPTAFTPNGDGLNDELYPLNAYKASNLIFRVYSRAGQIVFETRDWMKRWDGRIKGIEQATGTYVWTLEYTEPSGKRIALKGTTILIR